MKARYGQLGSRSDAADDMLKAALQVRRILRDQDGPLVDQELFTEPASVRSIRSNDHRMRLRQRHITAGVPQALGPSGAERRRW